MRLRNSKLHSPGTAQAADRAPETARRSFNTPHSLMLALQTLLGASLSGLAVSVQIGNVLVCLSMLLLGPSIILSLIR